MKRPLLGVALFYTSGILLADWLSFPLVPLCASAFLAALLALLVRGQPQAPLALLLVLAGAVNLTQQTTPLSPHDLRCLVADRSELATARGSLVETPYQRLYEHHEEQPWRTVALIDVTAVRWAKGDWQTARGRVAVSVPGVLSREFFAAQTVEFAGVLRPPAGRVAEGLFDYRTYLRRQGIYYQLQVASTNECQLTHPEAPGRPPLSDRFAEWAKRTLALGLPAEDEALHLLWAMTLGWKTALTNEVAEPFMRSGTMHIFAISGLHVALIAGILVSLFRVARVTRSACGTLVIPLIWFYTYATGWQASAIRSTVMMTVVIAGWSLRRPSDLLNSLAAAAFLILLWDPQQIFQASFQLSFFVVLSLALFSPPLETLRKRWFEPDPFVPEVIRPPWKKWVGKPLDLLTASIATSLAAWLGSIPLVAYYFHLFTPVSLLANLIVVPLSGLALASNLASLVVGSWCVAAAEWFNHSAWLWMNLMCRASDWAAHAPGGCFHVRAPNALTFALYYGLLVSVMAGWFVRARTRVWAAAALTLLLAGEAVQWQKAWTTTRVTVLPLQGGMAVYTDALRRRDDLLVDCGNEVSVQFVTKPFLQAQGVNRLPGLLLTHGDLRHVGGAPRIDQSFNAERIYVSDVRFRSTAYRQLLEEWRHRSNAIQMVHRGDAVAGWRVLHPASQDRFAQADDNVVVLSKEIGGVRILLLSDLGKPGQNALLQREPALQADIVVAGLPAKTEPVADAFLEAVRPKVIVIVDAEYPATERASRKLQQRLARCPVPVLYTRETGTVTVEVRGQQWALRSMSGIEMKDRDFTRAWRVRPQAP
jgi:DNA internalization-related competence protein ComEC/Rec2